MKIEGLKKFIKDKMRLSHLYQPLLIKELIENGGKATIRQLAISFLKNDESQINYFEKRIKDMPLKILAKHGIIKRHDDLVELNIGNISFENKCEISKLCEDKIFEFVSQKGLGVWDYRYLDSEYVPDSLRYRVLKESNGRCALCGITKDIRPLDVDHIIPKSKGGKTIYENLQVLCSKCNRSKNNKDNQDFRKLIKKDFDEKCIFCNISDKKILKENDHAFIIEDSYPV
ncbi:MAG: HNH endonuclease, partial [Promethearchaeota archaeon]